MRPSRAFLALVALLPVPGPAPAAGEPGAALDPALEAAARGAAEAARGIVLDDRAVVLAGLDGADASAEAAADLVAGEPWDGLKALRGRRIAAALARLRDRLAAARVAAEDVGQSAAAAADSLAAADLAARRARALLPPRRVGGFDVRPRGGPAFGGPGTALLLAILGEPAGPLDVTVENDGPGSAVEEDVTIGPRRLLLRWGPDPGAATVTVTDGTTTRVLRLFHRGGPGALGTAPGWGNSGAPPASVAFGSVAYSWRASTAVQPHPAAVTGAWPEEFTFTVDPPLPAGLSLDPGTGSIAGVPSGASFAGDFEVTVSNLHGSASTTISLEITPALPAGMLDLAEGFAAERRLDGLAVPVKLAFAPDGRLFFNELATGNVRVVDAAGNLLAAPFATVAVQTGAERGLLGLALAPDFATSGHLFVYAIVPAAGPKPVRGQVIRFTASGNLGGSPTVVVDDLPAGLVQNGGDLRFGPDGRLYVSVGDTGDAALAQADGARAGRVLRFAADGSIPADNPDPASPEWCRGLRNPFDLAFHAGTGSLFASENGPTFGDEVDLLLPGRNYGWETLPEGFPLHLVGPRVAEWTPVVAPTGIAFHSGTGFGEEFADDLLLLTYDGVDLRRLELSGPVLADLDAELPFAAWDGDAGIDHKPLDLAEAPDGSLWISTFTALWRIDRYAARNP